MNKKFSIPKRGLRSGPKIAQTTILAMSWKKQVRRGTYRESENLLRSIDIW